MAYQFLNSRSNPRPQLSDAWCRIGRQELIDAAPSCAGAFLSSLDSQLPELARDLVFLRHPDDHDLFAVCEGRPPGIGIQFDVHLEYIVVWSLTSEPRTGEYGDWGDGLDAQVQAALGYVRTLVAAP